MSEKTQSGDKSDEQPLTPEAIQRTRNYFLSMCDDIEGFDAVMLRKVCRAALSTLSHVATPEIKGLAAKVLAIAETIAMDGTEESQIEAADLRAAAEALLGMSATATITPPPGPGYLIGGKVHRQCGCDQMTAKCPLGVKRSEQTCGYGRCFIPVNDMLIVGTTDGGANNQ